MEQKMKTKSFQKYLEKRLTKKEIEKVREQAQLEVKNLRSKQKSISKNSFIGSSFESFLKEEGIFEEVNAAAIKTVLDQNLCTHNAKFFPKRRSKITDCTSCQDN